MSKSQEVIGLVNDAGKKLLEAVNLARETNPMAADLEVFKEMLAVQKRLGEMMQVISKIRGL